MREGIGGIQLFLIVVNEPTSCFLDNTLISNVFVSTTSLWEIVAVKVTLVSVSWVCTIACENTEIEPGELLLFSKGGAEILLSNDGKVYINGKEF